MGASKGLSSHAFPVYQEQYNYSTSHSLIHTCSVFITLCISNHMHRPIRSCHIRKCCLLVPNSDANSCSEWLILHRCSHNASNSLTYTHLLFNYTY